MGRRRVRLRARQARNIAVIGEEFVDKAIGRELLGVPQPELVNHLVVVYAFAVSTKLGATNDLTEILLRQNWRAWWRFRVAGG